MDTNIVKTYMAGEFPNEGELQTVIAPSEITEQGIIAIKDLLSANGIVDLPADWNWKWMVGGHGEYVGTLPKRLSKWSKQERQIKLSPEALKTIGNIAYQNSLEAKEYYIDFTRDFSWRSGDFGDEGSCYWSYHSGARVAMTHWGSYAIRFWSSADQHRRGIGRAWIIPQQGFWVVYNGYGSTNKKAIDYRVAARVLAAFWGTYYQYVALTQDQWKGGALYINSGRGALVGPQEIIASKEKYDLTVRGLKPAEPIRQVGVAKKCTDCGTILKPNHDYYYDGKGPLCRDCYEDWRY